MTLLENPGGLGSKLAPPEGIVLAAAEAYRNDESDLQPKRRHPAPETPPPTHSPDANQEGGKLPGEFEKKIDDVLADTIADARNGKFSPEGKKAWKDLFDYMKKDLPAVNQMSAALNQLGGTVNQVLKGMGSPNRIGMAGQLDSDGANFYMVINGPNISTAQNALDVAQDNETDTVIKAGRLERPKPQSAPSTP